ncbi:ABC transporter ATP-binding protein [Candidatus Latescibacterota bacterium]
MGNISLINSFIGKHWKSIAFGSCFVVITNLLHVLLPSLVGNGVDLLQNNFSLSQLYRICGLILLIELFKGVSKFLMRYIIIGASWKIENDVRKRIFEHLLKLPAKYHDKTRTGDIIARITNDLLAVRMMIGPAILYSLNATFLAPFALYFMFSKDAELSLYAIIPFPFIAVMMYFIAKNIHKHFIKVQESYSDISSHVQENLNGIHVIKSYVKETSELDKLNNISLEYVENNRHVIKLQSLMFPMLDVFASTSIIILLWTGGKKVINGETTIGVVVSLIMYIGLLIWPAIAFGWVTALFQRGLASMGRIREILDEEPETEMDSTSLSFLEGDISIRNLNYSYNESFTALSDISLEIKSGSRIAIVGRTGSGKSTLLGILSGIYEIERGSVFYGGRDICEIPLSLLRSSIAVIPQETFLFSDTIAENISFGREGADMQTIKYAAASAAIADEVESFPDKYETILGERGITLSGGQRQRVAIARALISESPIIFFDDSLSNVDTETEKMILNNLKDAVRKKTSIIVTQRLAAIKDSDEIFYMKDCTILEHGTHDTLMDLDGEYAALFKEQESIESLKDNFTE